MPGETKFRDTEFQLMQLHSVRTINMENSSRQRVLGTLGQIKGCQKGKTKKREVTSKERKSN